MVTIFSALYFECTGFESHPVSILVNEAFFSVPLISSDQLSDGISELDTGDVSDVHYYIYGVLIKKAVL